MQKNSDNFLPNIKSHLSCLNIAQFCIAYGVIGVALGCYYVALNYAKECHLFGKPLAGFQLQKKKQAEMITEITKA